MRVLVSENRNVSVVVLFMWLRVMVLMVVMVIRRLMLSWFCIRWWIVLGMNVYVFVRSVIVWRISVGIGSLDYLKI